MAADLQKCCSEDDLRTAPWRFLLSFYGIYLVSKYVPAHGHLWGWYIICGAPVQNSVRSVCSFLSTLSAAEGAYQAKQAEEETQAYSSQLSCMRKRKCIVKEDEERDIAGDDALICEGKCNAWIYRTNLA